MCMDAETSFFLVCLTLVWRKGRMDDDVFNGLWPIELCEEVQSSMRLTHRGKTISKRYVAELALSGKSICRKCQKHIAMNDLRMGAVRWLPRIGMTIAFFHVACFKRPYNFVNIHDDVQIMDSLTDEALDLLQCLVKQNPSKRRKRKVKEAPNSPYRFHSFARVFLHICCLFQKTDEYCLCMLANSPSNTAANEC